jgi:nitrilase
VKVTAVNEPPVYYDLQASLERGAEIIARAASDGSSVVVFSEAWLPGYIDFVWVFTPSNSHEGEYAAIYRRLWDNAVDLRTDVLAPIREAARENGVVVVIGIQEKSGGTLYNSGVIIDADGAIRHVHRKLMPTNPERQVWGYGDGSTLKVVETAVGRVGMLLCWENYMPFARMALYAQNVEIYCAPTAATDDIWQATMRHIAKEGGCAVIGVAPCVRSDDLPDDLPGRDKLAALGEWISPGNASIIAPGGRVLAGPAREKIGLVHADIDLADVAQARRTFDVVGHYARPDVFTLKVNQTHNISVTFD